MNTMNFRKTRLLAATALGLVGAVGLNQAAHAAGFGLREGSADWLGNAFVGGEAKAYDAGTVYSNPAGMALLNQDQVSGNISYIGPSATFTGSNSNPTALLTGQKNVSGITGGNAVSAAASGAVFGVLVLNPDWRLGMSVTNPYGERTSYDKNWVGRYQSLVSSITGVDFSVALSYKVNNKLSVGGGPVVEYYHARLTQAVNSSAIAVGALQQKGVTYRPAYEQALNVPDGTADVHGSDIALGYNLGALYQITNDTRIGLDYRSRIRHNIHGTQEIQTALPGQSSSLNARTNITSPDSISASIYSQVTPALALMSSVQWTHWGLFNTLNISPRGAAPGTIAAQGATINEKWRNTWFAGVGANYQLNDRIMLQTGFSYDESPVTNANRTPRVPDADHYNLGVGVKYKVLPSTTFDLAYLHVFTPGGTINSSANASSGTQTGTYDASDNSVTAGVNVVF